MSTGGLSKARLARMHDVMAGHVARGRVPGLVTLISRRGETHVDAIGMKAAGGSEPMRRDTIFRIASMTKPITAAAAMILVEEGKLRLDDPVDPWLPELADRKVLRAHRQPARRHRAGQAADHAARSADLSAGLGAVMVFARTVPDPEGDGRGRRRAGPEPGVGCARRADEALRQPAAPPSAGREVDVPQRLRHPGRADRARRRARRWRRSCASASSRRSA